MMLALAVAGCATQQAMTVNAGAVASPLAKYRKAVAVRTVSGGQAMNVLTIPGVSDEPFKAALEISLDGAGYLARSGAAKYVIDAEIKNLDQPLMGLDMDVVSTVTYTVSGPGTTQTYPITAKGSASMSDTLIGADRVRGANERAMQANIKAFMLALR